MLVSAGVGLQQENVHGPAADCNIASQRIPTVAGLDGAESDLSGGAVGVVPFNVPVGSHLDHPGPEPGRYGRGPADQDPAFAILIRGAVI